MKLVGKLDDSPGENTLRERFRENLKENAQDIQQVRSYIEECLENPGEQYSYALQDLVNHLASF